MSPEPITIPARLAARARSAPDAAAYQERGSDGTWRARTWLEVHTLVRRLAAAFRRLGLQPGDRVALQMPTVPLWEICNLAVMASGGAVVGLDAHDAGENVQHQLALARPRLLITWTLEQQQAIRSGGWDPELSVVAEGPVPAGSHALGVLLREPVKPLPEVDPDATATVIFTSGSTGNPRGVAYSHRQLSFACDAILDRFPEIGAEARLVCWLPLSNLFQRIVNLCAMQRGAVSWFVDDPRQVMTRVAEIRPTLFIAVPRFYEKLHAGILDQVARRPLPLRLAVRLAWGLGCAVARRTRAGQRPWWPLHLAAAVTDALILSRIRGLMGPDLGFMISGSAPMPPWLLERMHGLGWLVLEAYGASENVLPIAINTPEAYRFGSVGRPLGQHEVRIAVDGELLVRGPGLAAAYLGAGAERLPIDEDGFLHTGDAARIDPQGFIWLTGRKSEVFKTSTGRKIAPVPIEARIKRLPSITEAVVLGRSRPYPVAIINTRLPAGSGLDQLQSDLVSACADLPAHQRPALVVVLSAPFTIVGGELTSNLKLRRGRIEEKYALLLDALCRQTGSTVMRLVASDATLPGTGPGAARQVTA
ncbi:MAG: AMP-binding protein [Caulobacterales bacterium]|nr:AMP-binding protein [Caulobacterales bacterium]